MSGVMNRIYTEVQKYKKGQVIDLNNLSKKLKLNSDDLVHILQPLSAEQFLSPAYYKISFKDNKLELNIRYKVLAAINNTEGV